ncbi:MAG: hypothetical protein EGQ09_15875, partial [Clostridiales bacterium]|nr:hypothetical protein [Clostridiales bacterium]
SYGVILQLIHTIGHLRQIGAGILRLSGLQLYEHSDTFYPDLDFRRILFIGRQDQIQFLFRRLGLSQFI